MPRLLSPAKINLWLRVEGRRADGYHELTSLVLPLSWGDWLEVDLSSQGEDRLECEDSRVPLGGENLILRAAAAFRRETGISQCYHFRLEKNIPPGGGFGGGSGNAVTTLLALNSMAGNPLTPSDLHRICASLGSDCPLFLCGEPCVIKGRGGKVVPFPEVRQLLASYQILLLDPGFPISTAWAFAEWSWRKGQAAVSLPETGEEDRVPWEKSSTFDPFTWIRNDIGDVVRKKYLFYDALWSRIASLEGVYPGITGSGSGCFFLCQTASAAEDLQMTLRDWWPESGENKCPLFLVEAGLPPVHNLHG